MCNYISEHPSATFSSHSPPLCTIRSPQDTAYNIDRAMTRIWSKERPRKEVHAISVSRQGAGKGSFYTTTQQNRQQITQQH